MRRLLIPEVGKPSRWTAVPRRSRPLLGGFGVSASYGRLRDDCQTDVDGNSIDRIEETAVQLGLDAEQMMAPADHVLLDEARLLPARVVVSMTNGATHFVIVWRRHGRWLQLMDPGTGRRWTTCERFISELYIHTQRSRPAPGGNGRLQSPFSARCGGAWPLSASPLPNRRGWSGRRSPIRAGIRSRRGGSPHGLGACRE